MQPVASSFITSHGLARSGRSDAHAITIAEPERDTTAPTPAGRLTRLRQQLAASTERFAQLRSESKTTQRRQARLGRCVALTARMSAQDCSSRMTYVACGAVLWMLAVVGYMLATHDATNDDEEPVGTAASAAVTIASVPLLLCVTVSVCRPLSRAVKRAADAALGRYEGLRPEVEAQSRLVARHEDEFLSASVHLALDPFLLPELRRIVLAYVRRDASGAQALSTPEPSRADPSATSVE
jgi:hypothetical protein